VLEHHKHPSRDGVYVDAALTLTAAATLARDAAFDGTVTGNVYAQPLFVASATAGEHDQLIVATERNQVYALDASTGAQTWVRDLGAPVPTSALPCGNINPLGVTGTPIIEAATRTIYLDAMTTGPKHMIHALSLDDGTERAGGWPVDVNAKAAAGGQTFDSSVQNERGALALVGGRVYVPYGGHYGDCGAYRGWVVGVSTTDPTNVISWTTASAAGGSWAPSGVATDGTSLYITTGNTMGAATWGGGEALIKLPLSLQFSNLAADYFAPSNWQALDNADIDIGGTGPVLFDVAGATPTHLSIALGKDAKAYLVNRASLGGIGGQLDVKLVSSNQIIQAAVAYTVSAGTFVAFKGVGSGCPASTSGSLTALHIVPGSPPTISVGWCAHTQGNSSPAVSMSNASGADALVWQLGNDGRMRAFNAATGVVVWNGGGVGDNFGGYSNFISPVIAKGRVYVGTHGKVAAFGPH
jgi:outer membrane protein assembly factor BamB